MKKILLFFIILIFLSNLSYSQMGELAPSEFKRTKIVEKMDKKGLRFRNKAVIDKSKKMLCIPKSVKHLKDFIVAKTPPSVEFVIIPLENRFLPPAPKGYTQGTWSNWSQGTYYEPTKTFYAAVGNHRFHKSQLHLVEYDSRTLKINTLPEINEILGRDPNGFGDGKIHGWLDFYNGSNLYFCTYWCQYPEPSEEDYHSGYDGGRIMSYDVLSKKFTDFGAPLKRSSWPYHRMDTTRGLMFGVGMFGEFLCYDVKNRETRYAGYLPEGMRWFWRTMLVDEETGFVYTTNNLESDSLVHFVRYDPEKNRFFKMICTVPPNSKTGEKGQMRAHTRKKSTDGSFIGVVVSDPVGSGGELFKFFPDEDRVEGLGLCWSGDFRYTASLAKSPDEKYFYYVPAAHGKTYLEGAPVVQYNIETGVRKVISFLFPYFYNKFGYIPGGTYSLNLDETGGKLFILFNGAFVEYKSEKLDVFGDPAVMVINIPESERR